jgi:hypothetical protein
VTVSVRYDNSTYPLFRVLYADSFGVGGVGPWTVAPSLAPGVNGLWFKSCTRCALPAIGEAEIIQEFGTFDDGQVFPLDLLGKIVRIQAAPIPAGDNDPAWRTIWLGRVAWQDDSLSPGATLERGTRLYRCQDLLYSYLAQYPMDRHACSVLTSTLAVGHPGYNFQRDQPGVVVGNKSGYTPFAGPDGTEIVSFWWDDGVLLQTAAPWTTAEALENVMLLRRNAGDPIFAVDAYPAELLADTRAWEVAETSSAWSVATQMCDRRRGAGLAFLGWDDDQATPDGAINVALMVRPQLANDLTYTQATGESVTIPGATSLAAGYIAVDLMGDHRVVDSSFQIRDYGDCTIDELTTEGERILVGVTLSGFDGTLKARWTTAQADAWLASSTPESPIYDSVYQRFGLSRSPTFLYADGNAGATVTAQRGDYWTNALGQLSITHAVATSPNMVEIADHLPLYSGYDYTAGVGKPSADAAADGIPNLRNAYILMRTASDTYEAPEDGYTVHNDEDGMYIRFSGDESTGTRQLETTADNLTVSVGLLMPQRPRFYSAISGTVRRRKTIRIPGADLWIAHPGCIWDITDTGAAKRLTGNIGPIGGRILKDDRVTMARVHYLSWEWYRSDTSRYAVTYAIRDCGLLYDWTDLAGTAKQYARLGQCLTSLTAAGDIYHPNTPVTSIQYDNASGITTWHTDWQELDHGTA